jgi:hypothetical protein
MKHTGILKYLIAVLFMIAEPIFAGNVTVTLVGIDPLTINIKGDTQNEQAGGISIYLYFRDDATTDLLIGNVDDSHLVTTFSWGSINRVYSIEDGSWVRNGHTFTKRLYYDNVDLNLTPIGIWSTSGVNAIVINFTAVGTGHVFIELNGADGLANYAGGAHSVSFVNQDAALPVELSSFTAETNQSVVNLNWETKTEVNNYGFEVERKVGNGKSVAGGWEKIGFINGTGNSNSPKEYSLTDKNPVGGSKFIYRLKQIDIDGKYEYSKEVEVEIVPNDFNLFQNYPNPFNPATNIKFALPKAARVNLTIYNLLGEKVATLLNEDKEAGFFTVQFDASSLSSGVYIYRLTTQDFTKTMKMNFIK